MRPSAPRRGLAALVPAPVLSAVLLLAWLMLNQSVSAGQWLLGGLLSIVLPLLLERWWPQPLRVQRWAPLPRLAATVLRDIVAGNIDVARRVLGPEAAIAPRWVWVPLRIRAPHGIVALAGIVTMTPGTLSADLSDDRRCLLVHALHCPDDAAEAQLRADIHARYEAPLMEMLE